MDTEMRNILRFLLIIMAFVPLLLSQSPVTGSAEQKEVRVDRSIENCSGNLLLPLHKDSVVAAAERFVDNGDGTVTDTRRQLMWQKDDNGEEVTFGGAQKYCQTLRLAGHTDWRLPEPEERETAVVVELMMRGHSRDVYARFDLYWSADPTVLLPFNYNPSYGKEVLRIYPARQDDRAFVRAVRSIP